MSSDDDDDPFYSGDSSSDDGQRQEMEEVEEEEANESCSQVTFEMDVTMADFLIPGGLNAFTVALPAKSERLFLKDLPKSIRASGISKKNFTKTIHQQNSSIQFLLKTVMSENSTARCIHDSASLAIKRGTRSLDAATRKAQNLENELLAKTKKLTDVSKKLRQAAFDRDASLVREDTTSTTLKTGIILITLSEEVVMLKKTIIIDHFMLPPP